MSGTRYDLGPRMAREKLGKEVLVYVKMPDGKFREACITDVQGILTAVVFVEPNPDGAVW
jgi:hypothetical protein